MIDHSNVTDEHLHDLLRAGTVRWAGHRKLKIYGRLDCHSGKRMKRSNRVFFTTEAEAKDRGYRPCGNCHPKAYQQWKKATRIG